MRLIFLTIVGALLASSLAHANADDRGIVTLQEENDFFTPDNRDRHYTQGAQVSYLSPSVTTGGVADVMTQLGSVLPIFQDGAVTTSKRFDLFAGQEIFTPENKDLAIPDPNDRPYAGWINGGFGLLHDADRQTLDHLAVQLGIVGPAALGKQVQNNFHLAIDDPESKGWGFQLRNEPTVNFYFDRHRRFITDLDDAVSVDLIPAASVAVGSAFDYLALGARARLGQGLRADYGPPHIGPGPSGTDYFNREYLSPNSMWGWYVFVGAEGRAVARNIFLDGNAFASSRSVPSRPLIGDLEAGPAVFYSDLARLSYTYLTPSG